MLGLQERIDTYLAQNGSESRLTFRQERRLRKVANRQAKARRAQEIVAERAQAAFELSCTPLPEVIACPRCGATDENPCMTPSGKPARAPHKGREVAA
jgi:hypothetical protein